MKRILIVLTIVLSLTAILATSASPASARKDKFARKLHTLSAIVKELQTNYVDTLDADKIMNSTIDALLYQIDPYTEYYPSDNQDELRSISEGQYAGIGSIILKRDKNVIIHKPQEDSPSKRAGLRPGDVIIAVDGDTVTPATQVGDVSKRLRGQAGTEVRIDLCRPYVEDSLFTVTLIRDNIKVNPITYVGMDSDGIGYIGLTTFNESTARRVREAVSGLQKNSSLKGIVLDLRGNGGGLLEGAVAVASNFVPKGTEIVRTQGRNASNGKTYKTTSQPLTKDIPMAVLIDEGSASSSEIVAGAMQDLDRAVIVGERSYGKGLVQSARPLPGEDILKITTGRYYIPSGRLIQAIDYSHRDDSGRPVRVPDSLTSEFQTKAGRIVRDGGGITPDIAISLPEINRMLYNIQADMWAFDFANKYAASHASMPDIADSTVMDSLFDEFKAFIDPARFKYDRQCETALDYLRKSAEVEGYMNDSVKAQFDVMASLLKHDLNHDFDFNAKEIKRILGGEIAMRYLDDAEQTKLFLPDDKVYNAAKEVLLDQVRYKELLSPSAKAE